MIIIFHLLDFHTQQGAIKARCLPKVASTTHLVDILILQDLDVEGDGMQCPPSPLQFDTALALEDQTIRAIAEAPMEILTGEDPDQVDLDASGHELSERDVDAIMDDQVIS